MWLQRQFHSVDLSLINFGSHAALPGWKQCTTGCKTYEELPENARKYIERIEEIVGCNVSWIGTGPGRESMILNHGK